MQRERRVAPVPQSIGQESALPPDLCGTNLTAVQVHEPLPTAGRRMDLLGEGMSGAHPDPDPAVRSSTASRSDPRENQTRDLMSDGGHEPHETTRIAGRRVDTQNPAREAQRNAVRHKALHPAIVGTRIKQDRPGPAAGQRLDIPAL